MKFNESYKFSKVIKYCPNCQNNLSNSDKYAQGVKVCHNCGGRYHIIETAEPILSDEYLKQTVNDAIQILKPCLDKCWNEDFLDEDTGELLPCQRMRAIELNGEAIHFYSLNELKRMSWEERREVLRKGNY